MKNSSMKTLSIGILAFGGVAAALAMGGMGRADDKTEVKQEAKAPAATGAFTVDAVHSAVLYRIKHQNVAFNYGRFDKMSGSFLFNNESPERSVLEISVDADSINSGNDARDKHLRSADFFSTKEFPTMTFKGTSFKKASGANWEVTGDLEFRGVKKAITITVADTGTGPGRGGSEVAGFETTFTIKRSDFKMDYMLKGLSDEVTLTVSLEGGRK